MAGEKIIVASDVRGQVTDLGGGKYRIDKIGGVQGSYDTFFHSKEAIQGNFDLWINNLIPGNTDNIVGVNMGFTDSTGNADFSFDIFSSTGPYGYENGNRVFNPTTPGVVSIQDGTLLVRRRDGIITYRTGADGATQLYQSQQSFALDGPAFFNAGLTGLSSEFDVRFVETHPHPNPNLIRTSTFNYGKTDPWLPNKGDGTAGTTQLSVFNNRLRISQVSTSYGDGCYQSFPTVVGQQYRVNIKATTGNHGDGSSAGISNSPNGMVSLYVFQPLANGADVANSFTFTASATTTYLSLRVNHSTPGAYSDFDDITITRVDPANLISNGDFSDGTTTGWTSILYGGGANSTALVVANGRLRIPGGPTYGESAYTSFATVIGKKYDLFIELTPGSGGAGSHSYVHFGNTPGGGNSHTSYGALLAYNNDALRGPLSFTATATTTYLTIAPNGTGTTTDFDNVAVYAVSPVVATLAPQPAASASATGSPTLAPKATVTAQSASSASVTTSPALAARTALVPQSATSAGSTDSATLSPKTALVAQGAVSASPTTSLTLAPKTALAPTAAASPSTADNATLAAKGLPIQSAASSSIASAAVLTPKTLLILQAATSASVGGSPVLLPKTALVTVNASSASAADNVSLRPTVQVQPATSASLAASPALSPKTALVIASVVSLGEGGGLDAPNLVTNSDFSSGLTTGWTLYNGGTLTVEAGRLKLLNGATQLAYADTQIATVSGRIYRLKYELHYRGAGNLGYWQVRPVAGEGTTNPYATTFATGPSPEIVSARFTAPAAPSYFQVSLAGASDGLTMSYDNVAIAEVGPPVVLSPRTGLIVQGGSSTSITSAPTLAPRTALVAANGNSASTGSDVVLLPRTAIVVSSGLSASLAASVVLSPRTAIVPQAANSNSVVTTVNLGLRLLVQGSVSASLSGVPLIAFVPPTPSPPSRRVSPGDGLAAGRTASPPASLFAGRIASAS